MPPSEFQMVGNASGFLTCAAAASYFACGVRDSRNALSLIACHASAMKPAPFKYIAATSLEQALALKAEHGDEAKFLAGGQSLMPAMNFRLARPAILIDINGIEATCRRSARRRRRHADRRADPLPRSCSATRPLTGRFPLLGEALPHIAHPQIRNRGTIGGNLSHADPASELPAIAVALQRAVSMSSRQRGERWVAAADFFVGALTTDLEADEMLVEIELPLRSPRTGSCFMEIARRRGDFAIVGVAAMVTLDDHDTLQRCPAGLLRRRRNAGRCQSRRPTADRPCARPRLPSATSRHPCRHDRAGRQRPRHRGLSAPCRGRAHRAGADDGQPASARWTTDRHDITLTVNGVSYRRRVESRMLLSDFLRHDLALAGTHVGCEHGVCGACTVLLDGEPVRSCLMLAVQANNHEISDGRRPAPARTATTIRCSRRCTIITACNAATARPAS